MLGETEEYIEMTDTDMVLRGWWIQQARLGMTTTEAVTSLKMALHEAGYKIVRFRKPGSAVRYLP